MTFNTIVLETGDDGVATVTLNRPDHLNAFNQTMLDEMKLAWESIKADRSVRSVVLRGGGEKGFSSGVDPAGFRTTDDRARPFDNLPPGAWLGAKQNKLWKPIVAAVHGVCAGGAFYWLNEADIIICSDDARFFDPHVSFKAVAAVEPIGLIGRVSYGELTRFALMGADERITASTALRIGLVTEVTGREALFERAHQIAALLANKHPVAMQGSVRALWEARSLPHAEAVNNALGYPLLGNPVAGQDPSFTPAPPSRPTSR